MTVAGIVATAVLLLESATSTPPAGPALSRVTVPCEELPPLTEVGLRLTEARLPGDGAGEIVSVFLGVTLCAAKMVTSRAASTGCVATENVALLAPWGIVPLGGTEATRGLCSPGLRGPLPVPPSSRE